MAYPDQNLCREEKNALRLQYKSRRAALSADEKAVLDSAICDNFTKLASYRYAKTILMYYPVKGEIDILPIARHALAAGKRVAFPKCDAASHTMTFRLVGSLSELAEGEYSIPEPRDDAEALTDLSESLCIVPGLAFDLYGYRLGYGGGYYDRFLSSYQGAKLGLVYQSFIADRLPRGRYDRHVDVLVSERGTTIAKQN